MAIKQLDNQGSRFSTIMDVKFSATLGVLYIDDTKKTPGGRVPFGPYSQTLAEVKAEIGEDNWKKGFAANEAARAAYIQKVKDYNASIDALTGDMAEHPAKMVNPLTVSGKLEYVGFKELEKGTVYSMAVSDGAELVRLSLNVDAANDMIARILSGQVAIGDEVVYYMQSKATPNPNDATRPYVNTYFNLYKPTLDAATGETKNVQIERIANFQAMLKDRREKALKKRGLDMPYDEMSKEDRKIRATVLSGATDSLYQELLTQAGFVKSTTGVTSGAGAASAPAPTPNQQPAAAQQPAQQAQQAQQPQQAAAQPQQQAAAQPAQQPASFGGEFDDYATTADDLLDQDIPF
jgi:hypothetical protein